ncbi:MAG: alpha/beta hydrolase [Rhodococcus sp. (in: high G+C Gram-positive bacteria)]
MTVIDVVLHPDVVRDLRTVTELVESASAERGVTGRVTVSEDVCGADGDVVVVPASGDTIDIPADGRCVVRVDYGPVDVDRSPGLRAHITGRGLAGLRYAIDAVVHHRRHPAEVVSYGDHSDQRIEVRGSGAVNVALIHGGYWRTRWTLDLMDAIAIDLAERGYQTWNIEYRRPDKHGWAATTSDIDAAMSTIEGTTVIMGHSAGGQLALRWAADNSPALAVSLAGVLDLETADNRWLGEGAVSMALGSRYTDAFASSSPRARLPLGVPQIVVCAEADDPNLNDIGRDYVAAAQRAGDDVTLVEGPGGHFAVVDPRSEIWQSILHSVEDRLR